MKIIHLLNTSIYSGAENVVCQIIKMFDTVPDIEMVYCSYDGPIRDLLDEFGIRFKPIVKMSLKEIKRVLAEEKPDIIHAHDMRASFIAALASNNNVKVISHIHNNGYDARRVSLKTLAFLLASFRIRRIFWVSESAKDCYVFKRLVKNKSSVLYNIINIKELEEKASLDQNVYDYDICYIGRIEYPKNPERLIRVLEKCHNRNPSIKAAIIGRGKNEEDTKKLVNELNLQDSIHFLGFKSNPYGILSSTKVMIMTSDWEGTPMSALESLALGVPIVSTPVDGLKHIIINGYNGYLAEGEDELAVFISAIVEDGALRARLSRNAKEKSILYNSIPCYMKTLSDAYRG